MPGRCIMNQTAIALQNNEEKHFNNIFDSKQDTYDNKQDTLAYDNFSDNRDNLFDPSSHPHLSPHSPHVGSHIESPIGSNAGFHETNSSNSSTSSGGGERGGGGLGGGDLRMLSMPAPKRTLPPSIVESLNEDHLFFGGLLSSNQVRV
jgi:hypothetical protein